MQTYNTTYFSKAPLFTFIYGTKLLKKWTDLFFSRIGIEHFLIVWLYSKILSLNLGRFGRITKNVHESLGCLFWTVWKAALFRKILMPMSDLYLWYKVCNTTWRYHWSVSIAQLRRFSLHPLRLYVSHNNNINIILSFESPVNVFLTP